MTFGIVFDRNDNMYVTDKNSNLVQVFTSDGRYIIQFGGSYDGEDRLLDPENIGVDKESGTVYVADTGN